MIIQMTCLLIVKSELRNDIEQQWANDVSLLDATLDAECITTINRRVLVCINTCNQIQVGLVEPIHPKNLQHCRKFSTANNFSQI